MDEAANDPISNVEYTTGKVTIIAPASIHFDDEEDFARAVRALQPQLIMVILAERDRMPRWFDFVHQGVVHRTNARGYWRLEDLLEGLSQGIQDGSQYYDTKKGGFTDPKELLAARRLGYQSREEMEQSAAGGFRNCGRAYREAYRALRERYAGQATPNFPSGAAEGHIYRFALTHGFSEFAEFIEAMKRGFVEASDYRDARQGGFDLHREYSHALSLGIAGRDEYASYLTLESLRLDSGLRSHQEALILRTLLALDDGEHLDLGKLWDIGASPGKRDPAMSSDSPPWFTKAIEDRDHFRTFLLHRGFVGDLGTLFLDDGAFRRIHERPVSAAGILVDGSNVAWGGGSREDGDVPKTANLGSVLGALRDTGWEVITTIVDASLGHEIDDPRVYDRLRREFQIRSVPAGTEADRFLLQELVRRNVYLVSNDRYEEWKQQDPWLARNIDRFRVGFSIGPESVEFAGDLRGLQEHS